MVDTKAFDREIQKIPGEACLIFNANPTLIKDWSPNRPFVKFPECELSIPEQIEFMTKVDKKGLLVITMSPFIISDFPRTSVLMFDGKDFRHPNIQTYGTGVTTILTEVLDISRDIGGRAAKELDNLLDRVKTTTDLNALKEESRRFGMSVEKVFLFHAILAKEKLEAL